MEDLKNKIESKLREIEKMIAENRPKEEIEESRKKLDELLNEYLRKFK